MHIQDATKHHLPAILSILNHAISHTTAVYDENKRTLAEQEAWFTAKQNNNMPVLVIINPENKVLGYASYGVFRPFSGFKYCVEHSIYIHPDAQGLGFGSMLMKTLIHRAKKQGLHTMVAGIDACNQASINFHERFGFEHTGTLKQVGFKFGTWLDLTFMQLCLNQNNKTQQQNLN